MERQKSCYIVNFFTANTFMNFYYLKFMPTINLPTKPSLSIRGSLECFLCDSVKGSNFQWQHSLFFISCLCFLCHIQEILANANVKRRFLSFLLGILVSGFFFSAPVSLPQIYSSIYRNFPSESILVLKFLINMPLSLQLLNPKKIK